jgi:hypothetical protein
MCGCRIYDHGRSNIRLLWRGGSQKCQASGEVERKTETGRLLALTVNAFAQLDANVPLTDIEKSIVMNAVSMELVMLR